LPVDFKAMLGVIHDPVRNPLLESRMQPQGASLGRLLTAVPPPPSSSFTQPRDRSGSGLVAVRLRAASDMHQHGYISAEEKSLMKNLILSRNQRFKEEYNHAERTNNWGQLQQMLRSGYFDSNLFSSNAMMQDMEHLFGQMGTPPVPTSAASGGNNMWSADDQPGARKRMADTTTPVARVKKNTVPAFEDDDDDDGGGGGGDEDSETVAKLRKNERERQRRLAVSSGFDELCNILRLPQMSQKDKVSILRSAIDRIKELEVRVAQLEGRG